MRRWCKVRSLSGWLLSGRVPRRGGGISWYTGKVEAANIFGVVKASWL